MRHLPLIVRAALATLLLLFLVVSPFHALEDEKVISSEKKDEPAKVKLMKPESKDSTEAPQKQFGENPPAQSKEPAAAKPDMMEDGTLPAETKPVTEKHDEEKPVAAKAVEIQPPAKSENNYQPAFTLGGGLAIINTSGQIHNYLDTAVGVNLYAHTGFLADVLPIAAFAQAGYFNASSYAVQSMSFFYGQLGAGVPIDLPWDLTLFPYAATGIHTGKFTPTGSSAVSSKFLLASFDLGAIVSYRLSREIGITLKGGWMPVLDEFVTSNFWHVSAGASYAF